MKKHVLLIALPFIFALATASVQATPYPNEIAQLCKDTQDSLEQKEVLKCIQAQIEYLKPLVKENFDSACQAALDKAKLENDQKKFEEQLAVALKEMEAESDELLKKDKAFEVKSQLAGRAYELEASLLPAPKYSRAIRKCESKITIATNAAECRLLKLKAEKKILDRNYKKALAASDDKAALRADQKQWQIEKEQICYFGDVYGESTSPMELDCQIDMTRVRAAELAQMFGKK